MLVVIGMGPIEATPTVAINMMILATAVVGLLVLLLVHDRPFSNGGFTVEPVALRDIRTAVAEFNAVKDVRFPPGHCEQSEAAPARRTGA